MTNAYATRGSTGNKLIAGFDIHGGGIQIDQTCTYDALQNATVQHSKWTHLLLVNLINSSNAKINQLAQHLEHEGFNLFSDCYYNKNNGIHFIRIGNEEFRIKQNKILKLKL